MKPIVIAVVAAFAFSPLALAQDAHKDHDHSDEPAVEAQADTAAEHTCMPDHESMEDCMANMKNKMADGHMMDHSGDHKMDGDKAMMGDGHMAMGEHKMMEHGEGGHQMHDAAEHPMSAEECKAKHEAMGHEPAEHCPMMNKDGVASEEVTTE